MKLKVTLFWLMNSATKYYPSLVMRTPIVNHDSGVESHRLGFRVGGFSLGFRV